MLLPSRAVEFSSMEYVSMSVGVLNLCLLRRLANTVAKKTVSLSVPPS